MAIATEAPATGIVPMFRQVMRSLFRKASGHPGIMIALFVPPEIAAELALPGGISPEDLHLTLAVLAPDAADVSPRQIEKWAAEVERAAEYTPVLVGNVSGVGKFNGDQAGGADVVYATLDLPGLVELFNSVRWIGCETGEDIEARTELHDFTPHVTLAYGATEIPDVPTIPVRIDRLTLDIAGVRRDYLLAGADVAPAPGPSPTPAPMHAPGPLTAVAYRSRLELAEWSSAFVNDLPDSSFAIVLPGGDKDADGKTTPRSLRKLPFKDADGKVDAPHLRNALARVGAADLTDAQRATAEGKLKAAADAVLAKAADDRSEVVVTKAAETWLLEGAVEVQPTTILRSGIEWSVLAESGGVEMPLRLIDTGDEVLTIDEAIRKATATTADLAAGGMLAPEQGLPRKRRKPDGTMIDDATAYVSKYEIVKSEAPRRYTLGVAYPASDVRKASDPTADTHGDTMTADELELAAWQFMAKGAAPSGIMHKSGTDGAGAVVESYIYRGPTWKVDGQTVEPGDWLLGVIWEAAPWADIESGKLTGYSMQGYATREG